MQHEIKQGHRKMFPVALLLSSLLLLLISSVVAYPPIATEFYGNVTHNGSLVNAGSVITAYDGDGIQCGTFTMVSTGYFGLLSCMGDDLSTGTDEGATAGERISFFIDGERTRWFYNVTWISAAFHFVSLDRNYPPTLIMDDLLNSTEDVAYYYDVNATDPNGDNFTFHTNVTFFTIDPLTGVISFAPTNDDVGVHTINFTVNDYFGYNTSRLITFIVINVNDRPFFDPLLENQTVRARDEFRYDINVTDIDVGDVLTYYDNSTLFNISPTTGLINFTPTDFQIGNYTINITVCDDSGAWDNCTSGIFRLDILFSNHPPVMTPIGNQEWYANLTVGFDVNATDEDNDTFRFFTNSTIFSIDPTTGLVNFTPTVSMVRQYAILIGVTDDHYNVTETIIVTIFDPLICGDNRCSSLLIGESCYSCPEDCGTCPPGAGNATGDTGGLGGGNQSAQGVGDSVDSVAGGSGVSSASSGGVGSASTQTPKIPYLCVQNWTCDDWGPCIDGFEERFCWDENSCQTRKDQALREGTQFQIEEQPHPLERQACGDEPTCEDGIQNQNETGIDCGGPCSACLITPITEYPFYPFQEGAGRACGDNICGIDEGCSCMQDCMTFPRAFILYFGLLFFLIFLSLLVFNYTLYRLKVYRKGRMLQRLRRLLSLLGFLLFILIVFSLYLWVYGSCPYIVQRLLWMPLLVILIIPLIIYELLLRFGYVESRKLRRLRRLLERHKRQMQSLSLLEGQTMRQVEIAVSRLIYDLFQKKDSIIDTEPLLTNLYNSLIKLAKHRLEGEDSIQAETDAESLMGRILEQQAFRDAIAGNDALQPLERNMMHLRDFFHEKREAEKELERMKTVLEKERLAQQEKRKK